MKALITGASSGIGRDMARYLSSLGWELILTARNEENLQKLQNELKTNVQIIPLDLADEKSVFELYDRCKGQSIDLLVNNAGYGIFGEFDKTDLQDELDLINVNIKAVHILTKLFLRDFKNRNSGHILNVASSAGFMTGPLLSSYYASKNYVVRLSLAVYEELRRSRSKVKISIFCPGPVETNFNNRAGVKFSIKPISSEFAAKYAIDKCLAGKTIIIPSLDMKLGIFGTRFVPHKVLSAIAYNIQQKKLK
ncbi:MAG: SDR family NAD(P)-dependent oxidoreductase [Oscillospiraceae bacterium]|nr:SDR family NAD(P)-dependent oxidoreductase [Oscillospiraceae bacterium]